MTNIFILPVLALMHHRAAPTTIGETPTVEPINLKPLTMNELRIEYGLSPVERRSLNERNKMDPGRGEVAG